MTSDMNLIKNEYGYFEIADKPTADELEAYYAEKYYQDGCGSYEASGYTDEETTYFFNKIEQKYLAAITASPALKGGKQRFLDVGAGEGWAMKFFSNLGWECVGLDFSEYGCEANNPDQKNLLITGDIFENLKELIKKGEKYDLILLDNVLEHVLDPKELLESLHRIIENNGVLIVEVPNDFSVLQQHLFKKEHISKQFWVVVPDHLHYFNKNGLAALASDAGWLASKVISDYPIDFNLLNINTNYVNNPAVGKSCHKERVEVENLLHSISPEKTNTLYEALADLGLGRELTAVLLPKSIY